MRRLGNGRRDGSENSGCGTGRSVSAMHLEKLALTGRSLSHRVQKRGTKPRAPSSRVYGTAPRQFAQQHDSDEELVLIL